jgi:hypothetical protein
MTAAAGGELGVIAKPGQPGYLAATQVFNLAAPPQPAAAVTVGSTDQVRAAVQQAAAAGRPVRVHSTGHGAATASPMADALLLRVVPASPVTVDPSRMLVRIPAGAVWGDVVAAAAEHGLAVPHGSSALVGAIGFLLRGGISFYGRAVGLAANSIRAIELVTSDGRVLTVDHTTDPALYRALRGGGGGFGVVTAIELAAIPVAGVVAGATYWAGKDADVLLPLWLRWAATAPRAVTTSLRIMNLPPVPEIPPVLAAGPVLCVDGVVMASETGELTEADRLADGLLGPLLAAAEPLVHSWRPTDPTGVLGVHLDPQEPCPIYGDHMLLNELGEAGAAAFLEAVEHRSRSALTNAELRQLGGAFAEPVDHGGALDHLPASYAYTAGGVPFDSVTPDLIRELCTPIRRALAPWDTGRTVPSLTENRQQPQQYLESNQVAIVEAVRRRIDPTRMFRGDVAPNMTAVA